MNNGWPGFLALVFFLLLILLFVASASTPEVVAEPQLFINTGAALALTPTVDTTLIVAATASPLVSAVPVNASQSLVMPTLQPGAAVYVVQPGDWLRDIALRHNTTVPAILAVNPQLTNPDTIRPGDTLVLP